MKQQVLAVSGNSVEEFVTSLVTPLRELKASRPGLDFSYTFSPHSGLHKQRLTLNGKNSDSQILKFHKLTISVQNTRDFKRQLQQGIDNYINSDSTQFAGATSEQREDLGFVAQDSIEDAKSDIYRLLDIINLESLGKLRKKAQIKYLEFLFENVSTSNNQSRSKGKIYLQDFIRRLKLVDKYIDDDTKPYGDYLVNYANISINYRDMFSRSEALDILPIIPIIEGYLGETKDDSREEIQYIFGIKLKFDGRVQALGSKNVFEYHLNLLNPDSPEHQAGLASESTRESFVRKVLKIAFLYYFIFASRCNPTKEDYILHQELEYDPIAAFDKLVLGKLKGNDEAAKQKLFRDIYKYLQEMQVQVKINHIKDTLRQLLKQKTQFITREYPLHISVKDAIFEGNIETILKRHTLFVPTLRENPKDCLKYISIGEAQANTNSLCTLRAKVTFNDIHFFGTDDKQSFAMEYDLRGIDALPILFAPLENADCKRLYDLEYAKRKLIVFPYSEDTNQYDSRKNFIYQFTYSLLAYICLHVLLQHPKKLFVPILRLHLHNKQDKAPIEAFIVSLSNVLAHLLNDKHRSNSQGVDIRDIQSKGSYKIPNVMSSLYSILPKKFSFSNTKDTPELDKLAIIIVSSRESDRKWSGKDKISNLMGEIIGLIQQDKSIRVQLLATFSENYDNEQLFTNPDVIVQNVAKLYKKGFRHFLYIAKAPYTSTLHMTQNEEDGLFFMSKDVIKALNGQYEDINIYPMFFDKYYAIKSQNIQASSLYIQDTLELTNLVEDASKQCVVFFNLFNGNNAPGATNYYNGVISYATLLNIYRDVLDDKNVRNGLIYEGSLKNDILQYLTLFHFSRYQKSTKDIQLKLDPYENLIGDDSVGKLAMSVHMQGRTEFNHLAFLTLVKTTLAI